MATNKAVVSEAFHGAFILVCCIGWCGRGTVWMVPPISFPWAPRAQQKLPLFGSLYRLHKALIISAMIQNLSRENRAVCTQAGRAEGGCDMLKHMKALRELRAIDPWGKGLWVEENNRTLMALRERCCDTFWEAKTFKSSWIFGGKL